MGAFSYKALNEDGKTVKGLLEGDSERHVRSQLRAQKLKPLEVISTSTADKQEEKSAKSLFGPRGGKLNIRELSMLTRQLASLIKSGLPLDEALQACAKQTKKPKVKRVILQVRSRVLEGFSLAQAMGDNPAAFDDMYRALIRAGEGSGYLSAVMERLADYTQSSQVLKQRIKMAMIYPIVMMIVSIGVIVGMMVFVVPELTGIFAQNKTELPLLTQGLIATSNFFVNYGLILLLVIVAAIVGWIMLLKKPANRRRWDQTKLKLPVIGELIQQIDSSRFAATLSLLSASGVPLLQSLSIASQVMTNKIMQEACEQVSNTVREGVSLSRALEQAQYFPPLLIQLVASGETNGTLPQQLDNAARDQERDLEMLLGVAMSLLEPATIIFMGTVVGVIVMAVLTPIFEMTNMAR